MWLYDISTQQLVADYEAHTKRIWSLDFAPAIASSCGSATGAASLGQGGHLFATGSDDYTVKVGVVEATNYRAWHRTACRNV